MDDPHGLHRFVEAQAPVIDRVRQELRDGRKRTHWMWFVFPQLRGLGRSPTAIHYGIASLEGARAYLAHPVLGPSLGDCTRLVDAVRGRTLHDIFGSPDDMKFHSCMTLFAEADPSAQVFAEAIERHFGGAKDAGTLRLLAEA